MSENSDDNSPIVVAFVDEDELPLNSVGWGYVQRLSDEEVDSDLVQTSSESESEDDVEPPARNIRARLQNDPANNQWKEDVVEHVDLNFVEHVGSKLQMDESSKPVDFFQMHFTDEVFHLMVEQTNLYTEQVSTADPDKHKTPWSPVTVDELKSWLALTLNMGLVNKPTIQSYWATENSTLTPFFISTMSRTRYQQILRYLHFVDNSTLTPRGQDGYNKLGKIQPLLNLILPKFQETYCPSRNLSVDETVVKFKGKLSWKQFIKDKPARFGLKLFTLADADNGYVLSYKVYTGKDNAAVARGLAKRVVLELAEPFFNKGYNIFMDNYYTSVDLFEDLYTHGMQACGTCRTNRVGLPKDITSKDSPTVKALRRGNSLYRQKGKITCVTWQD